MNWETQATVSSGLDKKGRATVEDEMESSTDSDKAAFSVPFAVFFSQFVSATPLIVF